MPVVRRFHRSNTRLLPACPARFAPIALLACTLSTASAADYKWQLTNSTDWFTATNWKDGANKNGVPKAADSAALEDTGKAYTCDIKGGKSAEVGTLTLAGKDSLLKISEKSKLSVATGATVNSGKISLLESTIDGSGNLTIGGSGYVESNLNTSRFGLKIAKMSGVFDLNNSTLTIDKPFTNDGVIRTGASDASATLDLKDLLTNNGTLRFYGSKTPHMYGSISNAGSITVTGDTEWNGKANHTSTGAIDLSDGVTLSLIGASTKDMQVLTVTKGDIKGNGGTYKLKYAKLSYSGGTIWSPVYFESSVLEMPKDPGQYHWWYFYSETNQLLSELPKTHEVYLRVDNARKTCELQLPQRTKNRGKIDVLGEITGSTLRLGSTGQTLDNFGQLSFNRKNKGDAVALQLYGRLVNSSDKTSFGSLSINSNTSFPDDVLHENQDGAIISVSAFDKDAPTTLSIASKQSPSLTSAGIISGSGTISLKKLETSGSVRSYSLLGSLTFEGEVAQTGGEFCVLVYYDPAAKKCASTLITVKGKASLKGALQVVSHLDLDKNPPNNGDKLTVLRASDGITGFFNNKGGRVDIPGGSFKIEIDAAKKEIYLTDFKRVKIQARLGDANCDGLVNFDDIDCMVAALTGPSDWAACHDPSDDPDCEYYYVNDVNGDDSVNFDDIDYFISCEIEGGCDPEPPQLVLRGDSNCDGVVNFADIDCFVAAVTDAFLWDECHEFSTDVGCDFLLTNDINLDNAVDFGDIDGFVECLINGGCL